MLMRKSKDMITEKNVRKLMPWQDLRSLTLCQKIINVILPLPFLGVAWWAIVQGYLLLALIGWYAFFTASFRQAHDCYHRTIGIHHQYAEVILYCLSFLLLTSTHAVKETHLLHHKNPLAEEDIETRYYKVTWYEAILGGFSHWWSLQTQGYAMAKIANKQKILIDFALMGCMLFLSIILMIFLNFYVLLFHVCIVCLGNLFVGFIAGWVVHRGCDSHSMTARTERSWLVNKLTFNMWFHQEHHLFPAVPANNLPKLAKRLDEFAPHLTELRVLEKPTVKLAVNSRDKVKVSKQL